MKYYLAGGVAVIIALLGVLSLGACGDSTLFQQPPRSTAAAAPPPPAQSSLTLAVSLSLADLKEAMRRGIPAATTVSGGGSEPCANVPAVKMRQQCIGPFCTDIPEIGSDRVCADHTWQATIAPEGDLSLARIGDALRVELPVRIDGQAGIGGDLARLLSLSAKSFEAHLKPGADLRLRADERWCPIIEATPTNDWVSSATVQIIGQNCVGINLGPLGNPQACAGPVDLDLSSQLASAIDGQKGQISEAARSAISCDSVRKSVEAVWRTYSFPLGQVSGQDMFLNIVPGDAALSTLVVGDDAISLAARITADASISPDQMPGRQMSLPSLGTLDADKSRLEVNLRAFVDYKIVEDQLRKALRGQTYAGDTPAGDVKIAIQDVTVYPGTDGLVAGLKIDASIPGHIFDTQGWVYLTAAPKLSDDGTAIDFGPVAYAQVLDSAAWDAMAAIFKDRIEGELSRHARVDLHERLITLEAEAKARLDALRVEGVTVTAENISIRPAAIAVGADALVLDTALSMDFALKLQASALKP